MKLRTVYDTAEDIPEGYADLYAERNGKWELVGIEGVKTSADVERVQTALNKERADHKATKALLVPFEGLDPDTIHTQTTELESAKAQLEAINKDGRIDETKLEPIIAARVKQAVGPLERDKTNLERRLEAVQKTIAEKDGEVLSLKTTITTGGIERAIRDVAVNEKVLSTALDDVVMRGARVFELTEDGRVITRDTPGVTPGLSPKEWLRDMMDKAPHWWPTSTGGGSRGGTGGGPGSNRLNPWSKDHWNLTAQGRYVTEHGADKAAQMAESAGVKLGSTKPAAA